MHWESNTFSTGVAGRQKTNISQAEKTWSLFAGGFFLLFGLIRRSIPLTALGAYLTYRGKTGHCYLYQALDVDSARGAEGRRVSLETAVTVHRPRDEVYRFWRNVENFPRFMRHLESVQASGDGRSHWVARIPGGIRLEWDAQITEEQENDKIAWSSLPGADLPNRGLVRLFDVPATGGTEVRMTLEYTPPGGGPGAAAAHLLKFLTTSEVQEDLRRFKQLLETGEVATAERQPTGR